MRSAPVTIPVAYVLGILAGARAHDVATEPWLLHAGISPALLAEPAARVTGEQYVALFETMMREYRDEGLGFFSRALRPGCMALVMRSTLGTPTVGTAMRRMYRGFQLLQDDLQFDTVEDGPFTGVRLVEARHGYPNQVFAHELVLRVYSRLLSWLHGGRLRFEGFDFAFERPAHGAEYPQLFSGTIRFGQPHSTMWVTTAKLAAPMRRDEAALHEYFSHAWRNVVLPRRREDATSQRIRNYLQQMRPAWPDLPATADALHMSVSTLQRHLATEGSSFQAIKDQLRRDLAIVRLNTSGVALAALAAELGFSDQAVFQRAFKGWTGSAPGSYRQHRH